MTNIPFDALPKLPPAVDFAIPEIFAAVIAASNALAWIGPNGISQTTLAHSNDLFFRERLPWRLGLVQLDAGPTLMVHLHGDVGDRPQRVTVGARLDRAGRAVVIDTTSLQ